MAEPPSNARIIVRVDVAAVIVGDEVLAGHVQDANGPLVAQVVHARGHRLRRVAIVSDVIEEIAGEVAMALGAGCGLVVTSGGVGPTHDDRTLEAVALGLRRPLVECAPMRERIDGWIARASDAGVSSDALGASWLRRMALVPEGAELLIASTSVPAFAIEVGASAVCVLPGPPEQFQMAFEDTVVPRYLPAQPFALEEVEHRFPESMLSDALAALEVTWPSVQVGSYPRSDRVLVRLRGPTDDVAGAVHQLREQIVRLELSGDGRAMRAALSRRR